jgi:hypothetical protein
MPRKVLAVALVATIFAALCPATLLAQVDNAAKIASAMSAAPPAISKDATIVDWPDATGKMATLRQGTNGWTCLASQPASGKLVNNSACFDANFWAMLSSMFAGKPPAVKGIGYSYMLSNDWWEGNTSPTDTVQTPTNDWHHTGSHVMVYYPDKAALTGLPTHPSMTGPYVMWPNTPYAHVMWPVK